MPLSKGEGPIVVADGDASVRSLIVELLERAGHTARAAATGGEALAAAESERPALAILEVNLSELCGYEVCRTLRARYGAALPILLVSGDRVEHYDRVAGLLLGADDYLAKPFSPDELLARVHSLLRRARANGSNGGLTAREREVLQLLARGLAQREIAALLAISPKTVGTHIEHIHHKLGVSSRAQAVAAAFREKLVEV